MISKNPVAIIIKKMFDNHLKKHDIVEWFKTRKDFKIEYKNNTYIFTWNQAQYVEDWDCIVTNIPQEYKITNLEIIEQMMKDNFKKWSAK